MNIEIRNDSVHIEGYVNAVERDSNPVRCKECGECVEQIKAGTFDMALRAGKNVDMLLNHKKDRKIGCTADGTLTLREDSIGLRASADISDAEVIELARDGKLRGWSFGFRRLSSEIEQRINAIPRRVLTSIDLFEVSLIDERYKPCYSGTSVETRADEEEDIEVRSFETEVTVNDISDCSDVTSSGDDPAAENSDSVHSVHNEWCEPCLKWLDSMRK